ncbi:hypothetical protein HO173_001229 [Letharia columbiana]|uniref:J domain-containing protein n=1 Tax=Letharia columbiana TaxID=112416 RepID=A0A8H6G536_9LECA|nr:uncharacterized protein HO173_001229 [Letharia columbiana]KAF6240560.1 hypothetical protein HO173_001229 [Letharia columbiana]
MEDLSDPPTDINPYEVLEIENTATSGDVKSAYKKLALRYHPDKAHPDAKDTAHAKFQEIAFAYAILSDERRRKRYDTTGNTSESLDLEDDDFNWTDFFRAQWADTVTSTTIGSFKDRYQGSDEEKRDVLVSYTQAQGKLNSVFSQVMLSNPLHDEDRFREYIDHAIEDGEVEAYDAYAKEPQKQRDQRQARAKRDGKEAEDYAKKLGKYDQIFGDGSGKSNKKGSKQDEGPDLTELIQQRQRSRADTFLDDLEAKYVEPKRSSAKRQNGKKRKLEEPPEELFQRSQQKKQKAAQPEDYDEDEEEIDLENATPVSEDEDEEEVQPAKTRKRVVRGGKGRKKGIGQKK